MNWIEDENEKNRKIYVYVFLICEGENSAVNGNELSMSLERVISNTFFFYVCFVLSHIDAVHLHYLHFNKYSLLQLAFFFLVGIYFLTFFKDIYNINLMTSSLKLNSNAL